MKVIGYSTDNSEHNLPLPRHKLNIINELAAILMLFLSLALFRSRAFDNFWEYFIGGAEYDSGLYLWLVKTNLKNFSEWFEHIIANPLGYILVDRDQAPPFEFWFNTQAFYPYGMTLAWSDNFILPSLIIGGIMQLGFEFVAAWNTLIILASLLNGYFTYHLAFRLTGNLLSSFLAGLIFMTWPWFGEHLGHPQLQFAFFIPMAISACFRFINHGTIKSALLIFLTILSALLTTAYYAVFAGVAVGIVTIGAYLSNSKLITWRHIIRGSLAVLLSVPVFYPFVYPYFAVASAFGERHLYEAYAFAANGLSYLSAPSYSWLYGAETAKLSHPEGHLFPGATILMVGLLSMLFPGFKAKLRLTPTILIISFIGALAASIFSRTAAGESDPNNFANITAALSWVALMAAIMYCTKIKDTRPDHVNLTAVFTLLLVFFALISLGPLTREGATQPSWSPFSTIFFNIPGGGAIRAISRAGIMVTFSLSLLTALFFNRFPKTNPQVASLKLLLAVFILVENFNFIFPIDKAPKRPEIFSTLEKITSKQDAVFAFPYFSALDKNYRIMHWQEFAKFNVNFMNWSANSPFHLVNGYSGQLTWFMKEFPRKLANFPDERSLRALSYIANLKYIIVIPKMIPNFDLGVFKTKLSQLKDKIAVKKIDSDGNILLALQTVNEVGEDFTILTPPDRGLKAALTFEVRGGVIPGYPTSTLAIFDRSSNQAIWTEKIVHDGKFKKIRVQLQPSGENVKFRHLKLNAINEDLDAQGLPTIPKVFVRAPRFEVY
jgi:hypothetical protein